MESQSSPENKTQTNTEYFRKYREEHRDKIRQYTKKYYENNKKKCIEINKQYRTKLRDKIAEQELIIKQLLEKND